MFRFYQMFSWIWTRPLYFFHFHFRFFSFWLLLESWWVDLLDCHSFFQWLVFALTLFLCCFLQGLSIRQIRFRFDGQPINETDTPAQVSTLYPSFNPTFTPASYEASLVFCIHSFSYRAISGLIFSENVTWQIGRSGQDQRCRSAVSSLAAFN